MNELRGSTLCGMAAFIYFSQTKVMTIFTVKRNLKDRKFKRERELLSLSVIGF